MSVSSLTRDRLAQALAELGLECGDNVLTHSSFRRLGPVEGGPDTLLDAMRDAVGEEGNLMFPAFNYSRPLPEPYFDPAATPGRTGILPEFARKRPEALRSLHPTHSVAVLGPAAGELTRDHLDYRAFGKGSPLDRLALRGGKVLLLGVGHNANSTIHLAEEYAGIPKGSWFDALPTVKIRLPDGMFHEHTLDTSSSCSLAFGGAEWSLRREGAIRDGFIGSAAVQLMRGDAVTRYVSALLREKPDALLCTRPGCPPCAGARKALGLTLK